MPEITVPFLMGFNDTVTTLFNQRLTTASSYFKRFAMEAQSMSRESVYPRMEDLPGFREWIGDRVVNGLSGKAYAILNKTYEKTLGVRREDFEDDQYGMYAPIIEEMGQDSGELPDRLSFNLLAAGENQACYDGANFFSGGHVTYGPGGAQAGGIAYNNLLEPTGGDAAGPAWYLMATKRPLKPIVVQRRRPFVLTPRMNLADPSVFDRAEFLWGVDGRMNAGYGMWQLCVKCYGPLNAKYYSAARTLMASQFRSDGTPFGIKPDLLVHPVSLTGDATTLLKVGVIGTNLNPNPWVNTAEPLEVEWLT
jgi:phage major head subunit gpT-like protein